EHRVRPHLHPAGGFLQRALRASAEGRSLGVRRVEVPGGAAAPVRRSRAGRIRGLLPSTVEPPRARRDEPPRVTAPLTLKTGETDVLLRGFVRSPAMCRTAGWRKALALWRVTVTR